MTFTVTEIDGTTKFNLTFNISFSFHFNTLLFLLILFREFYEIRIFISRRTVKEEIIP